MSTDLIINDDSKIDRAVKIANMLAKSKIVPVAFQGKVEDIFAAIMTGGEMGMHPMQSLNAIVMIQGQATLKAQSQLAVVRNRIPGAYIKIESDEKNLVCKVTCARSKDDLDNSYTSVWDMSKAKQMGLAGKSNYIAQPMTMLRWRAITEALRAIFSDVLLGLYAPEELQDLPPIKNDAAGQLLEAIKEEGRQIQEAQRKPEDSQLGPLFLIENGIYRGKRLYEIDLDSLEEYLEKVASRANTKGWEKDLVIAIGDYLTNQHLYKEQIMELNEAVTA